MQRFDALQRQRRADRRERILDINAGHHGGDTAKKLLKTLEN